MPAVKADRIDIGIDPAAPFGHGIDRHLGYDRRIAFLPPRIDRLKIEVIAVPGPGVDAVMPDQGLVANEVRIRREEIAQA